MFEAFPEGCFRFREILLHTDASEVKETNRPDVGSCPGLGFSLRFRKDLLFKALPGFFGGQIESFTVLTRDIPDGLEFFVFDLDRKAEGLAGRLVLRPKEAHGCEQEGDKSPTGFGSCTIHGLGKTIRPLRLF